MTDREEIVARDDMHTLRRRNRRWSAEDGEAAFEAFASSLQKENERDFDAELRPWAEALEAELMANGWPPFCVGIEDLGGGKWRHDPKLTAEEIVARLQRGEKVRITRGEAFIEKHVEPLSDDYFRWRLRRTIERVTEERNLQHKLIATFELGRVQEIWKARRAFRKGFEAGRKSIEGGKRGTAERNAALAPKIEARLVRMEQLIEKDPNVERAADIAAREGFGPSMSANRQLWYRHRGKL